MRAREENEADVGGEGVAFWRGSCGAVPIWTECEGHEEGSLVNIFRVVLRHTQACTKARGRGVLFVHGTPCELSRDDESTDHKVRANAGVMPIHCPARDSVLMRRGGRGSSEEK
jgi:hypothetical protein